jgi:murein DD-endopeptidase MepM/ murein hydrolase activator NlpD
MHLKSFAVKVGDKVSVNTVVAYSGGGKSTASKYGGYDRCTTGAHLHYGLASGGWYGSSKSTPLGSFNSHTMNPPGYPGLYQWFYSR